MQVMISKTLKILLTFCCNKSNPPTYSCLTDSELNVPDVSMKGESSIRFEDFRTFVG